MNVTQTTNVTELDGDLLTTDTDVIAHQCNVVSKGCAGLAGAIFTRHPEVNTYGENPQPLRYTTALLYPVEGATYKAVGNLYTQFNTGPPTWGLDSTRMRMFAFKQALMQLEILMVGHNFSRIAFPRFYGSDLAGGNWPDYRDAIEAFAQFYPRLEVKIIGLPNG